MNNKKGNKQPLSKKQLKAQEREEMEFLNSLTSVEINPMENHSQTKIGKKKTVAYIVNEEKHNITNQLDNSAKEYYRKYQEASEKHKGIVGKLNSNNWSSPEDLKSFLYFTRDGMKNQNLENLAKNTIKTLKELIEDNPWNDNTKTTIKELATSCEDEITLIEDQITNNNDIMSPLTFTQDGQVNHKICMDMIKKFHEYCTHYETEYRKFIVELIAEVRESVENFESQQIGVKKTSCEQITDEYLKASHELTDGKTALNALQNKNKEVLNLHAQPEAKRKLSNWGEKRPVSRTSSVVSNEERKEQPRLKREGFVHSKSRINIGGITFDETRTGKGRSTSREFSIGNKVVEGRHPELKRIASQLRQSSSSSRFTHEDQLKKRDKSLNKKLGGMSLGGK